MFRITATSTTLLIRNNSSSFRKLSGGFRIANQNHKSSNNFRSRYFFSKAKGKDDAKQKKFVIISAWAKKIVTFIRVPFIAYSVYCLGLQRGIIDYAKDPENYELELMNAVLEGKPFVNHRQITEGFDYDPNSYSMIQSNGRLIVRAALRFAKKELEAALVAQGKGMKDFKDGRKQMNEEEREDNVKVDNDGRELVYPQVNPVEKNESEAVTFWENAISLLGDPDSWRLVLVDSPVPNAFVCDYFPRCIFVTSSFMNYVIENKHELGLVLGHEISHLIHGHVSLSNDMDFTLRAIELLVIALDPFDGKFTFKYFHVYDNFLNI